LKYVIIEHCVDLCSTRYALKVKLNLPWKTHARSKWAWTVVTSVKNELLCSLRKRARSKTSNM